MAMLPEAIALIPGSALFKGFFSRGILTCNGFIIDFLVEQHRISYDTGFIVEVPLFIDISLI